MFYFTGRPHRSSFLFYFFFYFKSDWFNRADQRSLLSIWSEFNVSAGLCDKHNRDGKLCGEKKEEKEMRGGEKKI